MYHTISFPVFLEQCVFCTLNKSGDGTRVNNKNLPDTVWLPNRASCQFWTIQLRYIALDALNAFSGM